MAITLTKRQQETLAWVLKGASNKEIARRLGVEIQTVKTHVSALLKKHGVQTRLQLCLYTNNTITTSLPLNIETKPFGWVLTDGNSIKGIVLTKNPPADNWKPFYIKAEYRG
jgi:DNA-binding CsgD family transcriptional regulator